MAAITFRFRDLASPEDMEAALREIRTWTEVRHAGPLQPDAKDARLQRMCYADLENDAEVGDLAEKVSKLPDVESVATPTPRKLVF